MGKPKLGDLLRHMLREVRRTGTEKHRTLGSGLEVAVRTGPDRLRLTRAGPWEPGEAAEREGHTCAQAIGWKLYRLDWKTGKSGRHYLIVTHTGLDELLEMAG
ncbi:hypothetical protein [Deinococcus sp. Marseille-Q6407]|uniref:hypothetical protein n=1 Tax=Deinococcus sp. Marseille-Q6407 TaxID=2969223 RepID=UPI0021BF173E|nr:hypothetical protein [Deinococcus sp. Marseille-Q6407]